MPYKKLLLTLSVAGITGIAGAQTLFTVNNKPVTKQEFLTAFNKNPDTAGNRAQKMREYLDMYINFKLKLQQAYDEKLDSKEEFKDEARNFKKQLTENYINEQANIGQLVHEAFVRSQKDILLAEVFVATSADTVADRAKIYNALDALKAGKSFDEVTATYTTDEALKHQKGNLGYITAFTLPYEVENIVYSLKPGEYSTVYHSGIGYHIFKNIGERPAAGKRKIQQLLLPVAEGFTPEEKLAAKHEADSIYQLLQKGAAFDDMVEQFSTPVQGMLPKGITTVAVGTYSSDFENKIFGLAKPGDITAPFETGYGYHIVKLLSTQPVVTKEDDVVNTATLQQLIETSDRLNIAKNNLTQQWQTLTGYKKAMYNEKDLWQYTDSAITHKNKVTVKGINAQTVLFTFKKQNITATEWITFLQFAQQGGSPQKTYPSLFKDFVMQSIGDYYRNHIEDYNPAIGAQMREFNEANLLFAVMDAHVWGKATQDTVALQKYYAAHKQGYTWAPGISALVVTAAEKQTLDTLIPKIKANPANWRQITGTLATADSNRYEAGQYPIKQQVPMQAGFISAPEKNDAGDAYSFLYVFNVYPNQGQRNFEDAKGMVINDYQQVLETAWLAELRKKYPVVIKEDVVKGLQ